MVYYYGTDSGSYCTDYERSLTTSEAKTAYYKDLFMTLVDGLKEAIGLNTAFIIRIGHRKENPTRWEMYGPIVQAQNELGKEEDDCGGDAQKSEHDTNERYHCQKPEYP